MLLLVFLRNQTDCFLTTLQAPIHSIFIFSHYLFQEVYLFLLFNYLSGKWMGVIQCRCRMNVALLISKAEYSTEWAVYKYSSRNNSSTEPGSFVQTKLIISCLGLNRQNPFLMNGTRNWHKLVNTLSSKFEPKR